MEKNEILKLAESIRVLVRSTACAACADLKELKFDGFEVIVCNYCIDEDINLQFYIPDENGRYSVHHVFEDGRYWVDK